ncbi:glycosyltransferase family 2 protein [Gallibacterium trehalosifermentans]|uniref:Glycosyltransferase family 2 protein n=1 Tax=Gallibacterium trehalosifermentans TaxID=516935 RepID=A0ABV6GXV9_9PAST
MRSDILVSVIIPCYNGEQYIEAAVNSILQQSYHHLEILVINDGSTDRSADILQRFAQEDLRVRYIENEQNLGLIATLNKAIQLAQGQYIARMDSDDIALPDRIEKQVAFFEQHPDIAVLGGAIETFGEGIANQILSLPTEDMQIKAYLFLASAFHHPTVMFNLDAIDKAELVYQQQYYRAEDYGLWVTLLTKGYKFANLSEVILRYRILPNSETRLLAKNLAQKNDVLRKIHQYLFTHLNLSLTDEQVTQYSLAINRANSQSLQLGQLCAIYRQVSSQVVYPVKKLLLVRWFKLLALKLLQR